MTVKTFVRKYSLEFIAFGVFFAAALIVRTVFFSDKATMLVPSPTPTKTPTVQTATGPKAEKKTKSVDTTSPLFQMNSQNTSSPSQQTLLPYTQQLKLRDDFFKEHRIKLPTTAANRFRFKRENNIEILTISSAPGYYYQVVVFSTGTTLNEAIDKTLRVYKLIAGDGKKLETAHPNKNMKVLASMAFDEKDFSHIFVFLEHPFTKKIVKYHFYAVNFNINAEKLMNTVFKMSEMH